MSLSKAYGMFGSTLLALLCVAQFTGWCLADYETVPNIPKGVRNNPGSYRSHYSHVYVHIGGK